MKGGIVIGSILDAPAAEVWRVVRTIEGVNAELAPWLRMTAPPAFTGRALDEAPLRTPIFASTLLFLGLVPFDRHRLSFESIASDEGFVERSTSLLHRAWRHERRVRPSGPRSCTLVDDVDFVPRIASVHGGVRALVWRVFVHRHARLRARFGGAAIP